ncbi:MAG: hypothetical protein P8L44_19250 [Opitutales bacterium]|jgi:hypothetical protein|nr:hypothetical protein [Opitutales bacterium]MDG2170051.1 hypothetical protein [Opitutales bacterium]
MNAEEEQQIEKLLSDKTSPCNHNAALTWLINYLEEGDILNLPPSKRTLDALKTFSADRSDDKLLKSKAKKAIKTYQR